MKLIFCLDCFDVFKLDAEERHCKCGKCSGRYINNTEAVTNGKGYSFAIGNGSLMQAVLQMNWCPQDYSRDWYIENCRVKYCWARPNEGPGNPHTKVKETK